ncbi:hypothetical protein [Xanthobacter sp. 126]|uniref:hypothetical protein n=1 Tax=Xanthobacter sp. 126 TaxID=1131814 RepID=UPI00045E7CFF|nr:hypothetical protein [Xanthobacter sp. 126]
MASEDERLVVALEARIRDFEKNFEKAQKTANTRFTAIERRAEASAENLKAAFSGAGASIASVFGTLGGAGILAGGGIAGAITTLKTAASSVADLAAEAKKAGVAFEPFQELKYAAEQGRVGVDALTDGLKEMQLRADEFIRTGAGSSEEAFKRLGYSAADLKKKLEDPAALFEEIIDKMKRFSKAGQIRIADEVFGGTGGEQFVKFMDQGVGSISRARQEARDLGVILSRDVAAEAQRVTQEFDKLSLRIEVALKSGVIEGAAALREYKTEIIGIAAAFGALAAGATLGPVVASISAAAAAAVTAGVQMTALNATILSVAAAQRVATLASAGLAAALRLVGGPWGIAITALVGTFAALAMRQDKAKVATEAHRDAMGQLDKAISEVKARVPGAEAALKALGDQHVENAEKALADARAELEYAKAVAANQNVGGWAGKYGAKMPTTDTAQMTAALQQYIKAVEEAQARLDQLKAKMASAPTSAPAAMPDPSIGFGYKDIEKASAQRLRDLQQEQAQLGMTTQAAAEYKFMMDAINTAAEHHIQLTPQQLEQLRQLAARYAEVSVSIEKTKASQQRMKELQSELGSLAQNSIMGLVDGTKNWNDVLKDSLKLLAELILKAALLGEGPLGTGGGGLIGSLFKGAGFAEGGYVKAASGGFISGRGTATSDSIRAKLSNGEFVVNAASTRKYRSLLEGINAGRMPSLAAAGAGTGAMVSSPVTASFSPTFNIDASGGGGASPEQLQQLTLSTIKAWWKLARIDVVNVVREARAARIKGV